MKYKAALILSLILGFSSFFVLYGDQEKKHFVKTQEGVPFVKEQNGEPFVKEYVIGPMDLLEIKVFELPELNQTVRVSEDGSITIPLLGKVMVEGLTQNSVEEKLGELLDEKYIKNAKVFVFIKEYQSQCVAVLGAVTNPGTYELVGRRTLLQIISQAGGFTEKAGDKLFVLREGKNGITANISIDLNDLLINGNQKLNIPLEANDVINVPVDEIIQVFVFGMVKNPGALQVKKSKKVTLLQAIAQAGGTDDGASEGSVVIKRRSERGKEIDIKVNLKDIIKGKSPDMELKEGDVVYVPESVW